MKLFSCVVIFLGCLLTAGAKVEYNREVLPILIAKCLACHGPDISKEPEHVLNLYGPNVGKQGSFARNCLVARRLAERDVRFIQLFHMEWDQHDK